MASAWQTHLQSSTVGSYEAHTPPLSWLFPTKSVQSVHGGLLQGGLVTCPATSSGKKKKSKQLQLGFQEKWGLGTMGWG